MTAPNLVLRIGSELELWNKVMKEVKLKRYVGPYEEIPFDSYIQSLIGLLPKDNGKATHLIFHLSYPRNGNKQSLNDNTPEELCRVKYNDFNQAVQLYMETGVRCKISKSDMSSVFRHIGIFPGHWRYLIIKAHNPLNGKWSFFVNKCLPFGAAISCTIFQKFSDAIAYLV